MTHVNDVHTRTFIADADEVGRRLDTLGGGSDELWVTDLTPPMILDRQLHIGSSGGHGAVRYRVANHLPGRSVVFAFDPASGLDGTHGFSIKQEGTAVTIRHDLDAAVSGVVRLLWKPLVLPIHSGVIEDIFDHLERELTGTARRHRPTSAALRWWAKRIAAAGL